MTKPKIIAREFTAAEPPVPPTEIWCESLASGGVVVRARNRGVWVLLWIDGGGVHFSEGIPFALGLPLDDKSRLKVAE